MILYHVIFKPLHFVCWLLRLLSDYSCFHKIQIVYRRERERARTHFYTYKHRHTHKMEIWRHIKRAKSKLLFQQLNSINIVCELFCVWVFSPHLFTGFFFCCFCSCCCSSRYLLQLTQNDLWTNNLSNISGHIKIDQNKFMRIFFNRYHKCKTNQFAHSQQKTNVKNVSYTFSIGMQKLRKLLWCTFHRYVYSQYLTP